MSDMADEHGFAHTSIGYVPITARRGGIKYPTPKGTPMLSINKELSALREQQLGLARKIAALEAKVKTRRTAPPADQCRWSIVMQFTDGGKRYEYLIFRTGGTYYTTGGGDAAYFRTWDGLLEWLGEAHWHSTMYQVELDYESPVALKGSDD